MPSHQAKAHAAAVPPRQKQSRYTPPKTSPLKLLQSRLVSMDADAVLIGAHLVVLLTSLVSMAFGATFMYRLGLLALGGIQGFAVWQAVQKEGGKISWPLLQEPALPYLLLSVVLLFLTRRALFPLQLALCIHTVLGILRIAVNSSRIKDHPALRVQSGQLKETLKVVEPRVLGMASHLELAAVPMSFLNAILGRASLLLPVFVWQFVRFLMFTQPRMGLAWGQWKSQAQHVINIAASHPSCPPAVRPVLLMLKEKLFPSPAPANGKSN